MTKLPSDPKSWGLLAAGYLVGAWLATVTYFAFWLAAAFCHYGKPDAERLCAQRSQDLQVPMVLLVAAAACLPIAYAHLRERLPLAAAPHGLLFAEKALVRTVCTVAFLSFGLFAATFGIDWIRYALRQI